MPDAETGERALTVKEVAARWHCAPGKVRTLIAGGQLKGVRIDKLIRICPEDVKAFEDLVAATAQKRATAAKEAVEALGAVLRRRRLAKGLQR